MPLDPKIIDKLYTHAQKQGIDMNILVRRWILENVKKLEKRQAARSEEEDR
jgi:hypothetical protein